MLPKHFPSYRWLDPLVQPLGTCCVSIVQKLAPDAKFRPLIGGMLASPAQRWPDLFGTVTIFKDYPYLLPCLAAAAMPLGAGVLGSLGLKEVRLERLSNF